MPSVYERPNVLVIMADEHAPMFSGPYGHPLVQTPNLNRLADEGVTFGNAYCNSPLCVPSRMSFMTGRYPSRIGVFDNASPLASDIPTWAHAARSAGYDVALAGTQHFVGPDQLHGFSRQLARDRHAENPHDVADWRAEQDAVEPWRVPERAGPGTGEHIEIDNEVAGAAVAYLRDPQRDSRPWLLCASFMAPHFPLVVPARFWDLYPLEAIDLPRIPHGHLQRQHPIYHRLRARFGLVDYPEELVRRSRAAYYGLITYLDEKVGLLLEALIETGQASNTLVIYTSDHGEMAGEHGLWRKSNFYEQAVRVPLQMRWPGRLPAGGRVNEIVSLVDLAASLFTVVADEYPAQLDGDDLFPLGRGEGSDTWKAEAFAQYCAHGVTRPMAMLRRGRYKLNDSLGDPPELYDLDADPGEFCDLALEPGNEQIITSLRSRLRELWDPVATERRVLQSQQERLLITSASGWTPPLPPELTREYWATDRGWTARPIATWPETSDTAPTGRMS